MKLSYLGAAALAVWGCSAKKTNETHPNIILILVDDMGYGDVGCYGNTVHRTPNIDQMAKEGIRFTDFYVASPVCSPSRASLLTGCYPKRIDMHVGATGRAVLFPKSPKGLNPEETTIAEMVKTKDYATAIIGKWHQGDQKDFLPDKQGFDYYFGIPYSNDMGIELKPDKPYPPLPLVENETVIENVKDQKAQNQLTKRYTQKTLEFIEENKDKPFFIFLSHNAVHAPLFASENFWNKSKNGNYGDAVEEIDWSTGAILKKLTELGIDDNTLVIFTSDNGAAEGYGGSNLPFSKGKGTTFEGGMREPCIMHWSGTIPENKTCNEITSTMDILPTIASIIGAELPEKVIDGNDISKLMFGEEGADNPEKTFFYYNKDQLQAVRKGEWKLHLGLEEKYEFAWGKTIPFEAALYNLDSDKEEKHNVYEDFPDKVKELEDLAQQMIIELGTRGDTTKNIRFAGYVENPVFIKK